MDKLLVLTPEDAKALERVVASSSLPEAHHLLKVVRRAQTIRPLTLRGAAAMLLDDSSLPSEVQVPRPR
jgi:hypothetical protein